MSIWCLSIFLVSFLISVLRGLMFSLKRDFTLLFKFIPTLFIVFEVIANENMSMISLLVCLLLVYRKATDACKLTLYHESLLKWLILFFLEGSWWTFKNLLHIVTYHLQIRMIWFFFYLSPFNFHPVFLEQTPNILSESIEKDEMWSW